MKELAARGHTNYIFPVAFRPMGLHISSGSEVEKLGECIACSRYRPHLNRQLILNSRINMLPIETKGERINRIRVSSKRRHHLPTRRHRPRLCQLVITSKNYMLPVGISELADQAYTQLLRSHFHQLVPTSRNYSPLAS
jgi:hypothetical protein